VGESSKQRLPGMGSHPRFARRWFDQPTPNDKRRFESGRMGWSHSSLRIDLSSLSSSCLLPRISWHKRHGGCLVSYCSTLKLSRADISSRALPVRAAQRERSSTTLHFFLQTRRTLPPCFLTSTLVSNPENIERRLDRVVAKGTGGFVGGQLIGVQNSSARIS